jgi:hypothetical protein
MGGFVSSTSARGGCSSTGRVVCPGEEGTAEKSTTSQQGGQEGKAETAASAAAAERCRWFTEDHIRTGEVARIRSRTVGDAAKAENTAPPWERTMKASGKEVKR